MTTEPIGTSETGLRGWRPKRSSNSDAPAATVPLTSRSDSPVSIPLSSGTAIGLVGSAAGVSTSCLMRSDSFCSAVVRPARSVTVRSRATAAAYAAGPGRIPI